MFQALLKNIALGALRHFLTGLGGSMVADGYITADENTQAVGAIMCLVGIVWSGWHKYKDHKNAVAAVTNAAPAPTPVSDWTGATVKTVPVETRPLDPIR